MRRSLRVSAAAIVAALVLAAGVASATAAAFTAVAPDAWDGVDMTLVLDEDPAVLMVAATLPASVKLPAEAQLVAPKTAQPQWLGEILGGDASADPSVDTSITQQGAYTVYSFRLTRSRTAQLETLLSTATVAEGDNLRASITWPAPQDAAQVRLSFRIPKSAKIVGAAEGAQLVTTDATANYYTRTFTNVKAGKPVTLTMTYNVPSLVDDAGGAPGRTTVLWLLAGGVAVAAVLLGLALARSRRTMTLADEDGEEIAGSDVDLAEDAWPEEAASESE